MKLLTWNINGIRTANKNGSFKRFLDSLDADIICLQETKITRNLLTEDIANIDGYYAFFSFSRKKGGYSGVATFCKEDVCAHAAEEGLTGILYKNKDVKDLVGHYNVPIEYDDETIKSIDAEGRAVITEHKLLTGESVCILNVYCPCVYPENIDRFAYKMKFNQCIQDRCKALLRAGKHVVVVGDLNVAHKRVDHCEPDEDFEKSEARKWLDNFLIQEACKSQTSDVPYKYGVKEIVDGKCDRELANDDEENQFRKGVLIDLFRKFQPTKTNMFTCWNTKSRARETNYGTRIDYILASETLASEVFLDCDVCPDRQGSDHCPVVANMKFRFAQSATVPSSCAMNMPEICGKQQRINCYFFKESKPSEQKKRSSESINSDKLKRQKLESKQKVNLLGYFMKTTLKKRNTDEINTGGNDKVVTTINADFVAIPGAKNNINTIQLDQPLHTDMQLEQAKSTWKMIFKGLDPVPLCSGHKEPAVLRTVKKEGPNVRRQFYVCGRPAGHVTNKDADCGFFAWKT